MITTFIITALLGMVRLIFGILPTIPATPAAVVSGGQWINDTIGSVISVLAYVFTPTLLAASVVLMVGIFSFDSIYHAVMWILRKIPVLNIK